MKASVTLREFAPGDRCEVDYAGDHIDWMDIRTGEIHQAQVFIGILRFSQLIFAWASEDEKSANWLAAQITGESYRKEVEKNRRIRSEDAAL